jgi:hypothetical protein
VSWQAPGPGVHAPVEIELFPPLEEPFERVRHLHEDEVGAHPPCNRAADLGDGPDPEVRIALEERAAPVSAYLVDHAAHGQVARPPPLFRGIAVDEEEMVDAVRGRGQKIAPEPKQVSVARVDARNRPAAHVRDFVRDGDARHRGAAQVVVRDEECIRDRPQHVDLLADVCDLGPAGRLDLAEKPEAVALEERRGRLRGLGHVQMRPDHALRISGWA